MFAHTCLSFKFLISAVKAISFSCNILSLVSTEGRNCSCALLEIIILYLILGEKNESNLDLNALKVLQTGHLQHYCWLVIQKSVVSAGAAAPALVFFSNADLEARSGKRGSVIIYFEARVSPPWFWLGNGEPAGRRRPRFPAGRKGASVCTGGRAPPSLSRWAPSDASPLGPWRPPALAPRWAGGLGCPLWVPAPGLSAPLGEITCSRGTGWGLWADPLKSSLGKKGPVSEICS